MAVTGAKFLELHGRRTIIISTHALQRLEEQSSVTLDVDNAVSIFKKSSHIKYADLLLLGYRPRGSRNGETSSYFYTKWCGEEMIIVVSKPDDADVLVWVTSYFKNDQTKNYRVFEYGEI